MQRGNFVYLLFSVFIVLSSGDNIGITPPEMIAIDIDINHLHDPDIPQGGKWSDDLILRVSGPDGNVFCDASFRDALDGVIPCAIDKNLIKPGKNVANARFYVRGTNDYVEEIDASFYVKKSDLLGDANEPNILVKLANFLARHKTLSYGATGGVAALGGYWAWRKYPISTSLFLPSDDGRSKKYTHTINLNSRSNAAGDGKDPGSSSMAAAVISPNTLRWKLQVGSRSGLLLLAGAVRALVSRRNGAVRIIPTCDVTTATQQGTDRAARKANTAVPPPSSMQSSSKPSFSVDKQIKSVLEWAVKSVKEGRSSVRTVGAAIAVMVSSALYFLFRRKPPRGINQNIGAWDINQIYRV